MKRMAGVSAPRPWPMGANRGVLACRCERGASDATRLRCVRCHQTDN